MIKLVNLTLSRSDKEVCKDLSVEIVKGEAVLIEGKNASGKSTLVDCLVGKIKPGEGQVLIDEHDIHHLHKNDRRMFLGSIGVVFHELSLRALDSVAKALHHHKANAAQVHQMLDFLGLESKAETLLQELSFSERKILDLARSLMNEPKVIIWDEPFVGLDRETREKFEKALLDLKNNGSTIIISTVAPENFEFIRAEKIIKL